MMGDFVGLWTKTWSNQSTKYSPSICETNLIVSSHKRNPKQQMAKCGGGKSNTSTYFVLHQQ